MSEYRLLTRFREAFNQKIYRHRSSNEGDKVAREFYEDMYELGRSQIFNKRVDARTRVTNRKNNAVGIRTRRGDGVFGEIVPGAEAQVDGNHAVANGPIATIEIGIEIKILAKAMIKQIDRVVGDAKRQAEIFREHHTHPICIGFVAINFAEEYVGFEGDRQHPTTGRSAAPHPSQEAPEAERRIMQKLQPAFDHFLLLRFRATNKSPYPFQWLNARQLSQEYGAMLTRVCIDYSRLFGP